ncbi:TRIC cation channel family protein [Halobacillus amylolyticus]|uniref:TRIC cation channel family protein n=1 Tax=Halobacillus amylolyticus TaxID=2932259 RepID=A0ABY4H8N8_9BACI|nr:TRIC cation channel family protein [Halobacillus amylolyticus]
MSFETLTIIAVSAFAFSGAIVALSERYDIFGTFMLGIATPFAGGLFGILPWMYLWCMSGNKAICFM